MLKRFMYTHDWIITVMMLLILSIGLMTIYSTSLYDPSAATFTRQFIFAISGLCIYGLVSIFDYSYLRYKPIVLMLYSISTILLLLDFIAGHTVRGATRWLSVGLVNLQPSELTKLILIIALASFLSAVPIQGYKTFLKSLAIVAPLAILVFIEPSLSATIVLVIIWLVIYFIAGADQMKKASIALVCLLALNIGSALFMPPLFALPVIRGISIGVVLATTVVYAILLLAKKISFRNLLMFVLVGILIGASSKYVVWDHLLHQYQKDRITAFVTQNDPSSTNPVAFQVQQSKIAVGSGELFGKGFAQGTQSKLNFLPDHNTDFIFASFSEEFGLIGDIILIGLFCILFFRILAIAERVEDTFGFLMIVGILAVLVFQTFANIAINIGLLPATGIPMPLVSYGGSSLIITCLLLAMVQSIQANMTSKKWTSIDA